MSALVDDALRSLIEIVRQLVREEVRAALTDANGDTPGTSTDDSELRQRAAARATTLKRARRGRFG